MTERKRVGPLVSVRGLEEYGPKGWTWTHTFRNVRGERVTHICRTGADGRGLWFWDNVLARFVKGRSNADFSLSRTIEEAYNEIKGWVAWTWLREGRA